MDSDFHMREAVQRFGRSLSAMVMPNIGAFIAWGLITAMFIPGGWLPNEHLAKMVSPMLKYLLPTLIAFTAGKNVSGYRGGVAGAVAAMGVIIGTDTPMFLGAMIMGPIAGWCVKKFDNLVKGKVGAGFEMLVDNFSLGIIAMLLAITGYLLIGGVVEGLSNALGSGVNWMLKHKLNPLLSLIVDPAKVVFLNNAVNHGIMTPLGIQQAAEMGHSMLFLVDPNPGPGLGILLACWVFGKGMTKQSAPGAAVIQLFGGIHEIYFPYVLARPLLLLPVIIGNICALSFFTLTDFGLVAPASPGSLISIILMSPRGRTLIGILGVFIATAISFLLAIPIIKARPDFQGENENAPTTEDGASIKPLPGTIRKIVFACDAGMGSSALGATRFKARLMKNGLGSITCTNSAVDSIPDDADIVVCQSNLADRVHGHEVVRITNFISDPALDSLLGRLGKGTAKKEEAEEKETGVLRIKNILTGLPSEPKEDAILRAGHMLEASGYVESGYAESMLEREKVASTYMGMGLAIPHGTSETKALVRESGIVVLQYPDGVDFGEEKARLVIGIAGAGDAHLDILAKISSALDDEEVLERLSVTSDPEDILKTLE
ncbi:MAG: PTS mannitol transporter subunit IICBA [Bacteroidales bacterium]|nr:PTS mannitol transporter subunit IICBA [Bacteroidales bacterium]